VHGATGYVTSAGQNRVVDVLLEAGADVNHRDNEGSTPLMCVARHGDLAIVNRLLVAGADVPAQRTDGLTAHEIAVRNGYERVASVIMSADIQVS